MIENLEQKTFEHLAEMKSVYDEMIVKSPMELYDRLLQIESKYTEDFISNSDASVSNFARTVHTLHPRNYSSATMDRGGIANLSPYLSTDKKIDYKSISRRLCCPVCTGELSIEKRFSVHMLHEQVMCENCGCSGLFNYADIEIATFLERYRLLLEVFDMYSIEQKKVFEFIVDKLPKCNHSWFNFEAVRSFYYLLFYYISRPSSISYLLGSKIFVKGLSTFSANWGKKEDYITCKYTSVY